MKNLQKAVCITIVSLIAALCFSACRQAGPLAAPQNLQADGAVLSWTPVDNASGYKVSIDGAEYAAQLTSYPLSDFAEAKAYQIKVKAVGDGKNYVDSDWSNVFEYKVIRPVVSLAVPSNLQINDALLTWDAVSGANGYKVSIDGAEYAAQLTSYPLSDLTEAKAYQIKVKAVGDGEDYVDSDWSAVFEYKVIRPVVSLAVPSNLQINDASLTWDAVSGASGYKVSIDGTEIGTADAPEFDLVIPALMAPGIYPIKVLAAGDGENYADSGWSLPVEYEVEEGGWGTEAYPFLIADAEDLWALSVLVNLGMDFADTYFMLTADIDLEGAEWMPIGIGAFVSGKETVYFSGIFNGSGHTVSNFNITVFYDCVGLFGASRGVIRNLGVENFMIDVTNSSAISCMAGGLVGVVAEDGLVENCYAAGGNVNLYNKHPNPAMSLFMFAGGLVGYIEKATVQNCYASVHITIEYVNSAGGLAGYNADNYPARTKGKIFNCFATGNITEVTDINIGSLMAMAGLCAIGHRAQSYRYEGQEFYRESTGQYHNPSDSGSTTLVCTLEDLNSVSFYTDKLGWDAAVWDLTGLDFAAGKHPTLR